MATKFQKMMLSAIALVLVALLLTVQAASAAPVKNYPITVTQPDGTKLTLYVTGDEFYRTVADARGYTVLQNSAGYYVYALLIDGKLQPSDYVVGKSIPAQIGLRTHLNNPLSEIQKIVAAKRAAFTSPTRNNAPKTGTLNNLVVFIRFADQSEYTTPISTYDGLLNTTGAGATSMKAFYQEASYNQITINSGYYPTPGTTVVSCQDSHNRSFYQPYNATTNPGGYTSNPGVYSDPNSTTRREWDLLVNAVNCVGNANFPAGSVIDGDGDGEVDAITFVIQGASDGWSDLLWPHQWWLGTSPRTQINGKNIGPYSFHLSDWFGPGSGTGVLTHEMFHALGAPDLYHYSSDGYVPVGAWDPMEMTTNPPQHMGCWMKSRYGTWINSIPTLSGSGTATLNPLTSSTNNCYKIASPNSATEFFILEYRYEDGATSVFERTLGTNGLSYGLLAYRINSTLNGNASGSPDEVYIYRQGGTTSVSGTWQNASMSSGTGRTRVNDYYTDPKTFLTAGGAGGLHICNVGAAGGTISFDYGPDKCETSSSPASTHDFGSWSVGSPSGTQTFTLTNHHGQAVTYGTLNSSNAEFAISNDNCSSQVIGAGSTCTFDVKFTPSATGARNATITFPDTFSTTPANFVNVTGTGTALSHTVTFNPNGGSGMMPPQTSSVPANLTPSLFTRTGYTFTGWNTLADGTGTAYADGASYDFSADVTLYAQWLLIPPTPHTVTFNSNGGTGFMSPQTASSPTVLDPSAFTLMGYTFNGWNTQANGSGTAYADGAVYDFSADVTLYAQWSINQYSVTYNANGGSGSMPALWGDYNTTLPLDLNSFTLTGYVFTGWNTTPDGSGMPYANGANYTFTADVTLYAQWALAPSTVTFDGNGADGGSMMPQSANTPSPLILNAFTRTGYTFTGWNVAPDGSSIAYADGATYSFMESVTLYAQWTPLPPHTVTFDGNGSDGGSMAPQITNAPSLLAPNAFTRTGYAFIGWNTQSNGSGTTYFDGALYDFTADLTLYAQWAIANHTVTFDANGGSGLMSPQVNNLPTALTLNAFTRPGFSFAGWNTVADGTGITYIDGGSYDFSADITLYAQWTALPPHTVTFDPNGGAGVMAPQTTNAPTALTLNTFTNAGFVFAGWNTLADGSGTTYSDGALYDFTADLTLYAQWTLQTYTVTFDPNGGTGTMAPQVAGIPAPLTLNTFTNPGFSFTGWNTMADGSGTAYADGATYNFTADVTLYAQWSALPTFTVTFDPNGGTGVMAAQSTNVPTALTLNAFTFTGYTFAGWNTLADGSGTAYGDGATYNFTADVTLYAQWTIIKYTVAFDPNGGAGVMAPQTGNYNTTAALTANAFTLTGYTFTGWNTLADGSGTPYANGANYTFTADVTLYAQWAINTYTVTFNANGGTGVMAPQNGNYNTTAPLTANTFTRTGYTFAGWNTLANGTGTAYADGADYIFTANITLFAQWTANGYIVTFDGNGASLVNPSSKDVTYGSAYGTLASATRAGYTLSGWYTAASGGTLVTSSTIVTTAADHTLYAHWTANTYTVTFNGNGGTATPASKSVTYNSAYGTLATATRSGYTFSGWYTTASGGTLVTATTVVTTASNHTLYAHWLANPAEMNVKGNSHSIADGDTTPALIDDTNFGSANVTTDTVSHTFTIENLGTANLNLTGAPKVKISGANAADFTVTAQPASPVGGSKFTTFTVKFDPSAVGLRIAMLSIANNDSNENPYNFALSGVGVTGYQYLCNGGFNSYVVGSKVPSCWTPAKFGVSDGKDTSVMQEGSASVRLVGGPSKSSALLQLLKVKGLAGDRFDFSFWSKGLGVTSSAACAGHVYVYNGSVLNQTEVINCPKGLYDWRKFSLSFNTNAPYTMIVVKFSYAGSQGTVWFDAASLIGSRMP